jgi:proteasome lid subunit RPN8/RPN11
MDRRMKAEEIQLSRKLTNQLLHAAQLSPESEICGLIGSINGIASRCYPIENIASAPESRFQLNPKYQINAFATMRNNGEELFAIYHSHPTAPAIPSSTDIELAAYPEAVYLIISLNIKGVLEIRGFKIIEKSVTELMLSLLP